MDEVRRVLASGDVTVDEGNQDKRTPLHLAASNGHLSMVKHLVIVHGANVNVVDRHNGTPISDAVRGKHEEVARFLYEKGAHLTLKDPAGTISFLENIDGTNRSHREKSSQPHMLYRNSLVRLSCILVCSPGASSI